MGLFMVNNGKGSREGSPTERSTWLRRQAESLNGRHGDKDPVDLLRAMIEEEFPGRIAVVTSFGAESAVLLDLVAQVSRDVPIIFLETRKHFPETLEYRETLIEHLGLTDVRNNFPDTSEIARNDPQGSLCQENPDHCCHIRKVLPLEKALRPFDVWITGRKRFQNQDRAQLDIIESDETHMKINPLVLWEEAEVADYLRVRGLPRHPMVEKGYPSIGCAPCTRSIQSGESPRAGRWSESKKTECGIHKAGWGR